MSERIDLNEISYLIHRNALDKGFWSEKSGEDQVNQILAKMMLIDSEVSELMESYRKEHGSQMITEEIVDVLIRLLDLYVALQDYGIVEHDVGEVLSDKMRTNAARPKKHGNLM